VRVAQVEVKLIYPALLVLQVRAVVVLVPDGHQDARRFPGFHDRYHLVGVGVLEVRVQEPVAPTVIARAVGRFENRSAPLLGPVLQPILELVGDVCEGLPGDPFSFAVHVEEAEHPLGLLERLDQAVEQETIKTPVSELDVMLMVLNEGVHGTHSCGVRYQEHTAVNASCSMAISKPARTFQDLLVWQKAHAFVLEAYRLTAAFPKSETYGVALQMRRAAVSIPANIAEGFRRRGKADKARFLNMAEGSVEECRYFLILTKDLGYGDTQALSAALEEVSKLLCAYTAAILASDS